jgi:hypothetical protein
MARPSTLLVVLPLLLLPVAFPATAARNVDRTLTREGRLAFIRQAQVWAPTNVPAMSLRDGPQDQGAFPPNALVTCDYVEAKLSGTSRKFDCAISKDDVVKVRYGRDNAEVEGAVLASRLLWALGFGADRVYPVRVVCRGCSPDPGPRAAGSPERRCSIRRRSSESRRDAR